ncbi:MAG: diphosphomevalonate decarboxylase [Bifidobacterium tibiigranuli]|jgi:diphosphomevalonate decarboxylase|uniref:diphosphomevalonate decarboxylase n=1 Tax=Bifidobacterium tibiigranuli TaxID=2172043 RepID=UPI0023547740|nr:diphosphomevalonate decarboxylase [Bifidobacterium tibiigranuli]MCH3975605.1 diphosphomevalonate decarboxylase [Bifidobacterium tibiigranuli]MCH4189560.1 diphosphomevalonate decarboxylase [Bifidobacterium tibiigranuli]MCH4204460.1 diphosphomevalonate decarboxylase [Bifidobacterium tibiigranuli]MCH4275155.1 diphosphomevalonate decarboxylase [Bifidobacterium tibiigranuli]MCI1254946.1 diphosphomevalonate decarboxylase [Bifidobacterium tibiigranuli]
MGEREALRRGEAMDGIEAKGPARAIGRNASNSATACAHANIALIKYWGKADEGLVIPTTSSLSLTLDGLSTQTTVEFLDGDETLAGGDGARADGDEVRADAAGSDGSATKSDATPDTISDTVPDTLTIDGVLQHGTSLARVSRFLDLIRERAGIAAPARVTSRNTVPFGAGLASSASAFAALAAAASRAAGLELSGRELSRLARRGSGSACRSIYGGLVKWNAGHDDATSYAQPVECPMDLAIIVILISAKEKPMSSREAMRLTMRTSPLYPAWVRASADDMTRALAAVAASNLDALGEVVEANALGMHASMMAARPAVIYWLPQTITALSAVRDLRKHGYSAWSTMDAGANVKVLTAAADAEQVASELRDRLPGQTIEIHHTGSGVRVVE